MKALRIIKLINSTLGLSLSLWLLAGSPVEAISCATTDSGQDTVYFRSSARLEFIEGETTDLSGWIRFDTASLNGPAEGQFRVDLRTMATGIDTRDEHMRQNHLHTDKFPYAYFELERLEGFPSPIPEKGEVAGSGVGYFIIHGVKRRLRAEIKIIVEKGLASNLIYSVRTTFALELDQYKIPRPKALFLKLAKVMEIELALKLHSATPPKIFELPPLSLTD